MADRYIEKDTKTTMTSGYGYIPTGLYVFMQNLAFENNLGIKEIQTMFMRKVAQDLGFVCDHSNIGMAKATGQPFCKTCWTRLITVKPPVAFKGKIVKEGEYWPIETFLDKFYKEKSTETTEERTRESEFEHEN